MKIFVLKSFAIFWAVATAFGILVLLFVFGLYVVLPGMAFLAGWLERRHLRPIVRLTPGHGRVPPRRVQKLIVAAGACGYREIGVYAGKLGLFRSHATLLLSGDDRILVMLTHDSTGPQLITRLAGGRRILTSTTALPDLAGLDEVELVVGDFEAVDARHRWRLAAVETEAVAFEPAVVEHHLLEHMREQVRRLHAIGLVRYLEADGSSWIYTAEGAWNLTRAAWAKITRSEHGALSETEAKVQRFRSRRVVQRVAVLQAFWLIPGGMAFEAAFPEWVSAFPPWVDNVVLAVFALSVIAIAAGGFAGFRCPICKAPFTDEGSVMLFARIEECDICGTAIDPGEPAASGDEAPDDEVADDEAPDDEAPDDEVSDDEAPDDEVSVDEAPDDE